MDLFQPNILVLMAAYNEEKTIAQVVRSCLSYAGGVLVADDGSGDSTATEAKRAGAIVVSVGCNKGYDAALDMIFRRALTMPWDVAVTIDADGQHDVADISRMMAPIISGAADVVLGGRDRVMHLCEKLFAWYTKKKYGIYDPLCGLKAYTRTVCERVGHFDTLNSIGTQLSLEAIGHGFRSVIVPIHVGPREDRSRFYQWRLRGNYRILRAMLNVMIFVP